MICPKCGEKYEDDMPYCLWCDAPNPNYAVNVEKLTVKKGDCQFENVILQNQHEEKCTECFENNGNISVERIQEIECASKSVFKICGKFFVFIFIVLPNVFCLNIWFTKLFEKIIYFDKNTVFFLSAFTAVFFWILFIFFLKKKSNLYDKLIVILSEFMIGFTLMEIVRKIYSL